MLTHFIRVLVITFFIHNSKQSPLYHSETERKKPSTDHHGITNYSLVLNNSLIIPENQTMLNESNVELCTSTENILLEHSCSSKKYCNCSNVVVYKGTQLEEETVKWLIIAVAVLIVIYGIKLSWLLRCKKRKENRSDSLTRLIFDHIKLVKCLDNGNFGEVWKAKLTLFTNVTVDVACKIRRKHRNSEREFFLEEAIILHQLQCWRNHPNIIKFEGLCVHNSQDLLVYEYMNGGSCQNFIIKNYLIVQMDHIRKIVFDVIEACIFLQERQYVHRDIALRNILVRVLRQGRLVVKLADFGLAKDIGDKSHIFESRTSPCNFRNTSPEGQKHGKFEVKSDVWSFGVFIWELFNTWELGRCVLPYENVPDYLLEAVICEEKEILPKPKRCPINLYQQVLINTWAYEPSKRPDFFGLKELLILNWPEQKMSRFEVNEDDFLFNGFCNEPEPTSGFNFNNRRPNHTVRPEVPLISRREGNYLICALNLETPYETTESECSSNDGSTVHQVFHF